MADANSQQIGGTHYQGKYQHWDFVMDTRMNYLQGNASKYLARWRKKNGVEDLRKADHYLAKAEELAVERRLVIDPDDMAHFWSFVFANDTPLAESAILYMIMVGEYADARRLLDTLLDAELVREQEDAQRNDAEQPRTDVLQP